MFRRVRARAAGRPDPLGLPARDDADAVVVVLAAAGVDVDRVLAGTAWDDARRVVLRGSPDRLHRRMRRLDRVDVVLDLRSSWGAAQLRAWQRLFPHVREGGSWIAVRTPPVPGRRERLAERHGVPAGPVRIDQQHQYLLKVPDAPASTLLPRREPGLAVTVLDRLESGTLRTQGTAVHHGDAPAPPLATELPYPVAEVRRYEGPVQVFAGRAYAVHGRSVLPESFRWHLTDRPTNVSLRDTHPEFARLRQHAREGTRRRLDGSYYYLDYSNTGHYGHLMTEAVARLWGWHAAKAADPDLRLLLGLHRRRRTPPERRPESVLLPAFGVDLDDVVWLEDDVEVTSLVGMTPLWHNAVPHYVHPAIRDTWDRLRTGLLEQPGAVSRSSERIFVSRRDGNRPVHNVDVVEQLFAEAGYTIVSPGGMSMPEQAATFSNARVVAGFGGTGMFNLAFAEHLETIVVLNHTAYDARNEELFAAALGADSHFFWSEPDLRHPGGGRSYEAFQSAWTFDVERNGEELRALLRDLV